VAAEQQRQLARRLVLSFEDLARPQVGVAEQ
jgi:hypothetical protein